MSTHYIVWLYDIDVATFPSSELSSSGYRSMMTVGFWEDLYSNFVKNKPGRMHVVTGYSLAQETHSTPLSGCLTGGDVIYVMGHGSVGGDSISPLGTDNGNALSSADVVARLIAMGLPQLSVCKLKLFACYSGVRGSGVGKAAFAERVRDELRRLNYNGVQVFGYTDSVSHYTTILSRHKRAGVFARASSARVNVDVDTIPTVSVR